VNFIGHGVAEIGQAMAEQAAKLEFVHSSQFVTPVAEEFAAELLEFAGANFRGGAVYFTSGGSEAVETALKLARQYQVEVGEEKRFRILSRKQSYHGATLGALAVSGNVLRREMYLPMVREYERAVAPNCYRCPYACQDCGAKYAADIERLLEASGGEAAAFILEPVSGATLGAAVPPQGYLEKVAGACARHGALLIADEVMTGCGRTGRNFAVEHWNVAPDLLVAGKGIASGYTPLGAVIANKKVVDAIAKGSGSFVHGFTYNAHPVSVAAGRAVLARMKSQKLVEAASSTGDADSAGAVLEAELDSLQECRAVGDVRGIGMLRGVEFVAEKAGQQPFPPERKFSSRVAQAAAARGVLVYPMQGCVDGRAGDHLLIAPPAVITAEEIRWAVAELRKAIEEVERG
jgi:adenosylmethionine-8-amino-7-oxononanoate aminotransferase